MSVRYFSSLVGDEVYSVFFIDRENNFHLETSVRGCFDAKDLGTRQESLIATFDTKCEEVTLKNRILQDEPNRAYSKRFARHEDINIQL